MSNWPSAKAGDVLRALHRTGWRTKRQNGSHRILERPGWGDYVFAFHDGEETGPRMMAKICEADGLAAEEPLKRRSGRPIHLPHRQHLLHFHPLGHECDGVPAKALFRREDRIDGIYRTPEMQIIRVGELAHRAMPRWHTAVGIGVERLNLNTDTSSPQG